MVEFNNNLGDVLKQIKTKLKKQYQDIYQEWGQRNFDVNHLFDVSFSILDNQICLEHTLLHIAASNGQLDTVKYLVEQRHVDVNQAGGLFGETALHLAAQNGHLDTVKYLVDGKNADVNIADNDGYTVLHLAAQNGHLDTAKYLIDEKGVDFNQVNNDGYTALHFAAGNGYLGIVKCLVENKADLNQKNSDAKTALRLATQFDELDVAEFLIAHEIKLKGSEAQKPDYLTEHRKISEYWDKCLDEIKKMQEEKIGGDITFYSILVSKSIDKLAYYVRNEQFTKVLERSNYRNKFPIYANDLDYLFKTAKQRVEALNIGETVIKHFDGLSKGGPAHLHIAEYLSNEDLKNLRKAAIQTMDEGDVSQSLGNDVRVESAAKKQGRQM